MALSQVPRALVGASCSRCWRVAAGLERSSRQQWLDGAPGGQARRASLRHVGFELSLIHI
eukprot:10288667-Alexandrium_andersonii.AAC.1